MEGNVKWPQSEFNKPEDDIKKSAKKLDGAPAKVTCPECGLLFFAHDNSLRVHVTRRHPEKLDEIMKLPPVRLVDKPIDPTVINANVMIQELLSTKLPEEGYECRDCGKEYLVFGGLYKHTAPKECFVCKEQFRCPELLKSHLKSNHESYINSNMKESHGHLLKNRKPLRKRICEICGKEISNMSLHLKTHQSEKQYKCASCPKSYKSKDGLEDHIKSVHLKIAPDFPCEICGKRFKHITQHKRVHETGKSFECDYPDCEYKSRFKYNVNAHKRKHTGEIK